MVKNIFLILFLLVLFLPEGGHAAAREMKQSELRWATTSGNAIRLKSVIQGVERVFGGTPVDARAFQADKVYYRILVKKPDGSTKIISIIRDIVLMDAGFAQSAIISDERVGEKIGDIKLPKVYADVNRREGRRGGRGGWRRRASMGGS